MRCCWPQSACVVVTAVAAIISGGVPAHAQAIDSIKVADSPAPVPQVQLQLRPPPPPRPLAAPRQAEDAIQLALETDLKRRLNEIHAICQLTESQCKKLELAGRGDIKRFVDRRTFTAQESARSGHRGAGVMAVELNDPPRTREGLFDWGSLLSKTSGTVLGREQFVRYEKLLRDRNRDMYRATVHEAVRQLARLVNMEKAGCEKLSCLILKETIPPLKFGRGGPSFVMFQASRIPENKLKEIIPEGQWKTFQWQLSPWVNSESSLRAQGFVVAAGRPDDQRPAASSDIDTTRLQK